MLAAATLVIVIVATCALPPAHPSANAAGNAAADDQLTVVTQTFDLTVDGSLLVTLGLPDGIDTAGSSTDAVIIVTSHPAITDRALFLQALDGELGVIDDEFEISLDPADADPNVTRPSSDSLSLTIPTSTSPLIEGTNELDAADPTTDTTGGADIPAAEIPIVGQGTLQFYETGVHPVEIELTVKGRRVADTATFVHIADEDHPIGDMPIGLVMGQTIQPTLAGDGTVSLTSADTDELGQLADTLAGIDAIPAALGLDETDVPRAVFVEPATLQAVIESDPDLAARLTPGLMRSDIVAAPRLPLEPSAAAASGQDDRYAQLLSDGEDLLSQLLPRTDIERAVHLVHEPFTTDAADLQRKMGARLMVVSFDFYDSGEGGNGMLTDTSQLVTIALPGGSSVPAAVLDPHLAARLDAGAADPMRTSIQIVADLLVVAQSIDDDGGSVTRHGMMLGRSDLGVLDPALATDLVTLLASTDGLRLVEPTRLGSSVDRLQRPRNGGDVEITLPQQTTADLTDRVQLIDEVSKEIVAFASMLPDNAPEVDGWLQVLDALPSTAVGDEAAITMVEGLDDDFDRYRSGIVGPDPFTFTLTGRHNTLSFSLRNTTDTDLEVRVRLSSPKLTFPDGDQLVTLPPGETEIKVRAEALSNGKSSVFLRVFAPAENGDIEVMPQVVLTARVSSLAGVGQLLTGAFLLLLLTWWGRHWQQTRRKRSAAGGIDRHPSSNGASAVEPPTTDEPTTTDDESKAATSEDLAPDAAASSLPPS